MLLSVFCSFPSSLLTSSSIFQTIKKGERFGEIRNERKWHKVTEVIYWSINLNFKIFLLLLELTYWYHDFSLLKFRIKIDLVGDANSRVRTNDVTIMSETYYKLLQITFLLQYDDNTWSTEYMWVGNGIESCNMAERICYQTFFMFIIIHEWIEFSISFFFMFLFFPQHEFSFESHWTQ